MNPGMAGQRVAKAKGLNCPNCGGSVELRGFAHTLSAVCPSCHSILDTSTPIIKVLQTVQIAEEIQQQIPLGTRGEFEGATYEVIGFQRREIQEGDEGDEQDTELQELQKLESNYSATQGKVYKVGERDGWHEYLLFNPYK